MKKICFLLLISLPLFSAKLINYNIYDRNDRVDLMLSFDSAYQGKISQKKEGEFALLSFERLEAKEELKSLSSKLINKIQISSKNNATHIMFQTREKLDFSISVINDKFGLRIRALPEGTNLPSLSQPIKQEASKQGDLMPKPKDIESYDYTNYMLVMLVLVLLLIVLWWFKKTNVSSKNFGGIKFQRNIDKNNQLVVLDYENKRYILIVGNSNLLLESKEIPQEEVKVGEENFNSFFENNKRKIQNIILEKQKKA
ncbi:hypothetical protein [Campylobacter vulpis]|uniref:hypothetical protein n=1 Tax=Campylobacter vulpis TaxID=1655500 RepID=UPI001BCBCD8F|nr:hypothetical protein [Campylobacter vulpis]